MDRNFLLTVGHGKQETIVAEAATENALPLLALKDFHIALKGVRCHLSCYARHAL